MFLVQDLHSAFVNRDGKVAFRMEVMLTSLILFHLL
jgi:hypothetical protein